MFWNVFQFEKFCNFFVVLTQKQKWGNVPLCTSDKKTPTEVFLATFFRNFLLSIWKCVSLAFSGFNLSYQHFIVFFKDWKQGQVGKSYFETHVMSKTHVREFVLFSSLKMREIMLVKWEINICLSTENS